MGYYMTTDLDSSKVGLERMKTVVNEETEKV